VKCEAHCHVLQPCLGGCAIRGTKELRKFYLLEFTVNATSTGWCTWKNLNGCRCPGLISVQTTDQCLRHALKRSHHSDYITNRYLLLSENLLVSLGLDPSGVDATGGVTPPPLTPRHLPSWRPLTMITCTHTRQLDQQQYNQLYQQKP
jgi:hypothetical protein